MHVDVTPRRGSQTSRKGVAGDKRSPLPQRFIAKMLRFRNTVLAKRAEIICQFLLVTVIKLLSDNKLHSEEQEN